MPLRPSCMLLMMQQIVAMSNTPWPNNKYANTLFGYLEKLKKYKKIEKKKTKRTQFSARFLIFSKQNTTTINTSLTNRGVSDCRWFCFHYKEIVGTRQFESSQFQTGGKQAYLRVELIERFGISSSFSQEKLASSSCSLDHLF